MKYSKIITQQPKSLKSPNITEIKSVNMEHSKTSHKLSKAKRRDKMVSQVVSAGKNSNRPLCSDTTKRENYLGKKNAKITK